MQRHTAGTSGGVVRRSLTRRHQPLIPNPQAPELADRLTASPLACLLLRVLGAPSIRRAAAVVAQADGGRRAAA